MYDFKNKVVVVTGGAHGIGKAVCEEFSRHGAHVFSIDVNEPCSFKGDIGDKKTVEAAANKVISVYKRVDFLVNNAPPGFLGISKASYEDFEYSLRVGVTAAFYLTKLFIPYFVKGGSVINISSSRDRMSQPETECYTAAKGAIDALTHSMAMSFAGKLRVNSISPGWIDTQNSNPIGADALQQPVGRVGVPEDIASMVLYLCSDKASFITGENICIDGGMSRQMIFHNDFGWKLEQ